VGYKKTEGLEQQRPEVLVDGEPLNRNQEVSADGDMSAKNTFVEPISGVNHVPSAADPNPVPSDVSLFVFILFQFVVTQYNRLYVTPLLDIVGKEKKEKNDKKIGFKDG